MSEGGGIVRLISLNSVLFLLLFQLQAWSGSHRNVMQFQASVKVH